MAETKTTKLAGVVRLAQGLGLQLICYFGIFLSLIVSARALDPTDFGVYASSVAIANFFGSILTFGLDRLSLKLLLQQSANTGDSSIRLALLLPMTVLNVVVVGVCIVLPACGIASWTILFIALLGAIASMRLSLSGFFKFGMRPVENVVATFGLQPLVMGLVFGALWLAGMASVAWLSLWMGATLAVELAQVLILLRRAQACGLTFARDPQRQTLQNSLDHAKAGIWISLLVLLAQTGVLGLSIGTLIFPASEMGIYTVALRMSQLLQFPLVGATQMLLPITVRDYPEAGRPVARREARQLIRLAAGCTTLAIAGFAVLGHIVLPIVIGTFDTDAYYCTIALGLGYLGMAVFGVGDQIMIAIGHHRTAFWISFWCGGVMFLALAAAVLLTGGGVVALACATAIPITARAIFGYLVARRLISMPIAVFD